MSTEHTECTLATDVVRAARMLAVSPGTIRALLRRGQLRSLRIGRRRLIPLCDIHALVRQAGEVVGDCGRGERLAGRAAEEDTRR
jgi:excisionase family DNA binding protein